METILLCIVGFLLIVLNIEVSEIARILKELNNRK